jgi:hypothetical protein
VLKGRVFQSEQKEELQGLQIHIAVDPVLSKTLCLLEKKKPLSLMFRRSSKPHLYVGLSCVFRNELGH